jgi:hypothetical protein
VLWEFRNSHDGCIKAPIEIRDSKYSRSIKKLGIAITYALGIESPKY